VFQHPRCLNAIRGERPTQERLADSRGVRGLDDGRSWSACTTCHGAANFAPLDVPDIRLGTSRE